MRVRFHTQSGSMYVVDSEKLTWERVSDHGILGYEPNQGKLAFFTPVTVGLRYQFSVHDPSNTYDNESSISTTPVVKAEII